MYVKMLSSILKYEPLWLNHEIKISLKLNLSRNDIVFIFLFLSLADKLYIMYVLTYHYTFIKTIENN